MFKALVSFGGIISMSKDEIREINDKNIAKDLLDAGYIEAVKSPRKTTQKKIKRVIKEDFYAC